MTEALKIMLSLSLSASLIAALLLLLGPLLKKQVSHSWRYYIWLVVILRLLIPFSPEANLINLAAQRLSSEPLLTATEPAAVNPSPAGSQIQPQGTSPEADPTPILPQGQVGSGALGNNAAPLPESTPTASNGLWSQLRDNLWLAWLMIALLLLVRKVTSYHSFLRFIRAGCQPVRNPKLLAAYAEARREMGVAKTLPLATNKLVSSPMLAGFARPTIVLPEAAYSEEELRLVLCHELVHYKRRDILYKWLVQLTLCLHWFNPLLYLVQREIDRSCELSCDELVLRRLDRAAQRRYGDVLLQSVKPGGNYGDRIASLTMSEDAKQLKERLESIMQFSPKSKAILLGSLVLALFLAVGAIFLGSYNGAQAALAANNPPTPEPTLGIIGGADGPTDLYYSFDYGNGSLAGRITEGIMASLMENVTDGITSGITNGLTSGLTSSLGSLSSLNNIFYDGRYTYSLRSYYQDGYFLEISWRANDDPSRYAASSTVTIDGQPYTVAFNNKTQSYVDDAAFLPVVRQAVASFTQSTNNSKHNYNRTDWQTSVFVIEDAEGPYSEDANTLAQSMYERRKVSYFASIVPYADRATQETLLRRACEENQDEYVYFVLRELPDDYNADELAWIALERDNEDTLFWLLEYLSTETMQQLIQQAAANNQGDIISLLIYMGGMGRADFDGDEAARQAFASGDEDLLFWLMDCTSEPVKRELLLQAVQQNQEELAETIFYRMSDTRSAADEAAAIAYANSNLSMFETFCYTLSKDKCQELAEQAYRDNRINYFEELAYYLPWNSQKDFYERAQRDGKSNFVSLLQSLGHGWS